MALNRTPSAHPMNARPKPSAVIFAKDTEALARFYRETSEMTEVHRDSDHIVLDEEGFQLVVHGLPKPIAATIQITSPPEVRACDGYDPEGNVFQVRESAA